MTPGNITATYGVSEQITPSELAGFAALGFSGVICNRPDSEVTPDICAKMIAAEAEKLGLSFLYNPISHAGLTDENLAEQAKAMNDAKGPLLAYCRSGQRSAMCWALLSAAAMKPDEVIAAVASAGYDLQGLRPHLETLHQG